MRRLSFTPNSKKTIVLDSHFITLWRHIGIIGPCSMRLISTLVTYESSQKSHPCFLEFATSGAVSWWKWIFFLNRRHFALENWVGHCVHDVLCFVTSNFATKGIVCIIQCHCKLNSLNWITSHCNSNLFDISEEMSEATTIQEKAFFLLYTLIGRDSWTIWWPISYWTCFIL